MESLVGITFETFSTKVDDRITSGNTNLPACRKQGEPFGKYHSVIFYLLIFTLPPEVIAHITTQTISLSVQFNVFHQ